MAVNILVPELGESVLEATVGRWLKQEGDRVAAGEPLVELETDKVNLDVAAERAGVLARIERPAGTDVKIGEVLGVIEPMAVGGPPTASTPGEAKPEDGANLERPVEPPHAAPEPATPVAKRLGEALGVDLARVPGSGRGGRVTKEDVRAFAEKAPPVAAKLPAPARAASLEGRREERAPMSRRRRTIARRLVEAQQTAAMLTTFNEIDMGEVVAMRRRHKEDFAKKHGVGLGYTSFFVKASVGALKDFPLLNAEIQGKEVILKHYYDIGIAVGASEGLVVPVLRDADRLSFAEIEQGVKDFAERARDGRLTLDDLRGGTFTLTNGGVFGSLLSTPILNPPQVGILGMHKIEDRPVARDGQVVVRPMMYVALTYDHRLVDGREAVQFLVRVKELIEDPGSMLLEV